MDENFEPSILAVCVDKALSELLSHRQKSAVSRCQVSGQLAENPKCDACDDSACGMEVDADSSPGMMKLSDRTGGRDFDRRTDLAKVRDCSDNDCASSEAKVIHAQSGRRALEILRKVTVDLVLVGEELNDMPLRQFVSYVRATRPWQRWAMVGSSISQHDEVEARTLGALAVFDSPVDWAVINSIAAAAAEKRDLSNICLDEPDTDYVGVREWATRLGLPMAMQDR